MKKLFEQRKHYSELTKDELEEALDMTIPDLDMPVRLANILEGYGILTVRDLLHLEPDQLLSMNQMGEKNMRIIFDRLGLFGFYNRKPS